MIALLIMIPALLFMAGLLAGVVLLCERDDFDGTHATIIKSQRGGSQEAAS